MARKYTGKISFGWLDDYKKFERLVELRDPEAISLMFDIFGDFESSDSIFNQIIQNPEQTSYVIIQGNSNQINIGNFDVSIGNQIPRDIVLGFIDGSLIVLVDIVQKSNSSQDLKTLNLLSNFCYSVPNILIDSPQYVRLSQAFLLLGNHETSLYCNDQANKIAVINHEFIQVYENYFFIYSATFNYNLIFEILEERINFLQQNQNLADSVDGCFVWQIRRVIMLIECRYYCVALADLNQMPHNLSVVVMTLICRYYLKAKLYYEEWEEIKLNIFQAQNLSYQLMLLLIECAWIYGEREFCTKRAQSLLLEPPITLPINRYYKEQYEFYASGKFPRTPSDNALLKDFKEQADFYYSYLMFEHHDEQDYRNQITRADFAFLNAITLARRLSSAQELDDLLNRYEVLQQL